jgi:hypothetical protein
MTLATFPYPVPHASRGDYSVEQSKEENLPGIGIDTKLGKPSAKVELDGTTVLMLDTIDVYDQLPPPLQKQGSCSQAHGFATITMYS